MHWTWTFHDYKVYNFFPSLHEDTICSSFISFKKKIGGTPLAVQWLRLRASTAVGTGSIPGSGTKIPHALQQGKKKKKLFFELCLKFSEQIPSCNNHQCFAMFISPALKKKFLFWLEHFKANSKHFFIFPLNISVCTFTNNKIRDK